MHSDIDYIIHYHERTKHHLDAYAKGPASLDWDDQPNPFRRFTGTETIRLPKPGGEIDCLFTDLDTPGVIVPRPLDLNALGLLLELSFGLSAWKQFGPDRWALRCNPSSGNLHPTEAYVICNTSDLLEPGVYHYASHDHQLERRCRFKTNDPEPALFVGLSSIYWREAWKYGERAFRYCQHDIGHALAALSYAAACLGWTVELCSEASDEDLRNWLGLNRPEDFMAQEPEAPDCLCRIHVDKSQTQSPFDEGLLSLNFQDSDWYGRAEKLSQHHFYQWPIIEEVAAHCSKPATEKERWLAPLCELPAPAHNIKASRLIRQRRSAQRFNGKAELLPLQAFHRIMLALLPNAKPPFTAWNWLPQTHIVLFVHRVIGLEPGLYILLRDENDKAELQQAFSDEFVWERAAENYALYRLSQGNARQAAKTLSCHQTIASDSFFSLGMLVRFAANIEAAPWRYRRLFWECGLLGQILYLEAEAAGYRGSGIGCFFDDAMHGLLGLQNAAWQSLYHFTVGEPLEDERLQTLPAYSHLAFSP